MPQQRAGKIADLGAGCGALSILLAGRLPKAQICGFEIDPASCATLARNIRLNHLQARVRACCCDLAGLTAGQADLPVPAHSFDVALSNPPYRRPDGTADRARTEDALPLDALLRTAGLLLKPRGRLFLVHRASRLPEVLLALARGGFAVRTLRLVQSLPGKPPFIFLLSATWQGKPGGFRAEAPLILRHPSGSPTAEAADWYGHEIPLLPGQLRAGLTDQAVPAQVCGKEDRYDVR
jgi:tRNA1(Val) A37 N6-methylase TrmN6